MACVLFTFSCHQGYTDPLSNESHLQMYCWTETFGNNRICCNKIGSQPIRFNEICLHSRTRTSSRTSPRILNAVRKRCRLPENRDRKGSYGDLDWGSRRQRLVVRQPPERQTDHTKYSRQSFRSTRRTELFCLTSRCRHFLDALIPGMSQKSRSERCSESDGALIPHLGLYGALRLQSLNKTVRIESITENAFLPQRRGKITGSKMGEAPQPLPYVGR